MRDGRALVLSRNWSNGSAAAAGAVTFIGASGLIGTVSAVNSLIGTAADDRVDNNARVFADGNYAVLSNEWDRPGTVTLNAAGAVSLGRSAGGLVGPITFRVEDSPPRSRQLRLAHWLSRIFLCFARLAGCGSNSGSK